MRASESVKGDAGTWMVVIAGLALIGYGCFFVFRNFTGFIELGLTPALIGGTPDEIRAFSPRLFHYISHLQVALAGFIIAIGIAIISLAWNGMRVHERWAAWTVVVIVTVTITLPLHYVYGLATWGHLGALYADALLLLAGSAICLLAAARAAKGTAG
jgi:hypothetical protein